MPFTACGLRPLLTSRAHALCHQTTEPWHPATATPPTAHFGLLTFHDTLHQEGIKQNMHIITRRNVHTHTPRSTQHSTITIHPTITLHSTQSPSIQQSHSSNNHPSINLKILPSGNQLTPTFAHSLCWTAPDCGAAEGEKCHTRHTCSCIH